MSRPDTRTKLLDTAETLVRRKGAEGFSYADMSAAIGIRKASIHYHFPAKTDLLNALMTRYARSVMGRLRTAQTEAASAAEQVDAFLSLYREALGEGDCVCLCVAYSLSPEVLNDATRTAISEFRMAVIDWLTTAFLSAENDQTINSVARPDQEAHAALALVEGAQVSARFSNDTRLYDKAVAGFRNRLTL